MPAPPPSSEALRAALDYDAETGRLTWRQPPHPRIRKGAPAGTINRFHNIKVVGFKGRKLPAHRVAWALHTGEWPPSAILFGNGDATDLRFVNMALEQDHYATTHTAEASRRYYARRKQRLADRRRDRNIRSTARYPNVSFSLAYDKWHVLAPDGSLLHASDKQEEAEAFALARFEGISFVDAHPAVVNRRDGDVRTGTADNALTLAAARVWLAYDPETGALYWRQSERNKGLRADRPHPTNGRSVLLNSREYPAHMLAVLLTKSYWPRRRSVTWKNGKRGDNRWTNLAIADDARPAS